MGHASFIGHAAVCFGLAAAVSAQQSQDNPSGQCQMSEVPQTTIGATAESEFGRVAGLAFVGDTVIAIGDGLANNLTFYSYTGRRLGQYGRLGQGPGEFRGIRRVFAKMDTAVVYDGITLRASLFVVGRGYIRSIQVPRGLVGLIGNDVVITAANMTGSARGRSGPEIWPDTLEVQVQRPNTDPRRIARIADRTRLVDVSTGMSIIYAPFSREPAMHANEAQVVVADGGGQVHRFAVDGARVSVLQAPFATEPLASSDWRRWIEHEVSATRPELQPARRRLLSVAVPPATRPAHGALVIDRASNVWVQEYRAPYDSRPAEVTAFNPENRLLLRGSVPARARLVAASRRAVAFVVTDDLDAEVVAIHAVRCSTG